MKVIFIDTETTGFDDKRQDIIQIAGLVTENREILESFNFICSPVNFWAISKEALKVTGKTVEELKTFPPPREAFIGLKAVLDSHVVKGQPRFIFAGQNVPFDKRFLSSFWQKHKTADEVDFEYYFSSKISYDLMDMTRPLKKSGKLNVPNVKLGTIMEALDIKPRGNLHDALTDIIGTCDSFYAMADRWIYMNNTDPTYVNLNASTGIQHLIKSESINIK
jgi:DNA polymerase III epsilon subunit-like protein